MGDPAGDGITGSDRSRAPRWSWAVGAAALAGVAVLAVVEAVLVAVGADAWLIPRSRWDRGLAGWRWSSPRSVVLGAVLAAAGAVVLLRSRRSWSRPTPAEPAATEAARPPLRASAPGIGLWVLPGSVEAHVAGVLRSDPDIAAASVRVGRWRTVARVQVRPGVEDHAAVARRASRDAGAAVEALGVGIAPLQLRLVAAGGTGAIADHSTAAARAVSRPEVGTVLGALGAAMALAVGVRLLAGAGGLSGTEPGARYRDLATTTGEHPAWWAAVAAAVTVAVAVAVLAAVVARAARRVPGQPPRTGGPHPAEHGAGPRLTTATARGTTVVAGAALGSAWSAEMASLSGVRETTVEPIDLGVDGYALRARVTVADAGALDRVRRALPGTATRLGRLVGGPPVGVEVVAELAAVPPPGRAEAPARAGDAVGR